MQDTGSVGFQATVSQAKTFPPATGKETLLALVPFLILGLTGIGSQAPMNGGVMAGLFYLAGFLFLAGILPILAGLLAGWLAGFPRWVYPYVFYSFIFSLYLSNASTPGLKLFNVLIWGREIWGWRAWIPLLLVILLALLLSRPRWEKLSRLAQNVAEDWSLLAFSLYGLLPFTVFILLDEINHATSFPLAIAAEVLLIVGAFLYMRLPTRGGRVLGLVACAAAAMMVVGIGAQLYWKTHYVNFSTGEEYLLPGPVPLGAILTRGILPAIAITLLLLSPGLIALLRRVGNRSSSL